MAIATGGWRFSSQTVRAVDGHPVLEVGGDHLFLNHADNLWFLASEPPSSPACGEAMITVLVGFVTQLEILVGSEFGAASVVAIPPVRARWCTRAPRRDDAGPSRLRPPRRLQRPPHAVSWRLVLTASPAETLTIPIRLRGPRAARADRLPWRPVTAPDTLGALLRDESHLRRSVDPATTAFCRVARPAQPRRLRPGRARPGAAAVVRRGRHTAAGSLTVAGPLRGAACRDAEQRWASTGRHDELGQWRLLGRALSEGRGWFRLVHTER